MKHFALFFIILILFVFPGTIFGFTLSQITNHQVPESYFFPQEFDKLVMDLTLPSGIAGQADELRAVAFQNTGTARYIQEISKAILWQDAGREGFQGMGIDKEIGQFTFYYENSSWYLDNLKVVVPASGLRVFIAIETAKTPVVNSTLQTRIVLLDQNQNKKYDLGDLGIFLSSENNGPADEAALNLERQTMRIFTADNLAPKTAITSLEDGAIVTSTNFLVKGMARDQGGSVVKETELSINDIWFAVQPASDNYYTWQYNWQDIKEGTYTIKAKSEDFMGNTERAGDGIAVTMAIAAPVATSTATTTAAEPALPSGPEPEPAPSPSGVPAAPPEKSIAEMTAQELEVKISEIISAVNQLKALARGLQGKTESSAFLADLQYGGRGDDVALLQESLIKQGLLANGLNTGWFGPLTKTAVIQFQEKYAADILTPWGLTKGTGFVGKNTRAKLRALSGK